MKKKLSIVGSCLLALTILASCSNSSGGASATPSGSGGAETGKPIPVVFGDAGWDSMRFHNAVAALIGETAYNIEASEVSGSTAITYTGLKGGDIQVYMETWTDGLPTYQDDLAEGSIKELAVNYADNAQGLYVPRYVIEGDAARGIEPMAPDLKTVKDLANYPDLFPDPDDNSKGRIYGAISSWEVDKILRLKYEAYGLDEFYNYMDPGSDSALAAAISAAYEKGEPIVAYYWEPTWITGKYDLVLLQDEPYDETLYYEGKCEYPSMRVTVCVNSEFYAAAPEYCEFLSHYETSSALTAEALSYIQENDASYEDAAHWFLQQHDELLTQWLPSDKAELVRTALGD